MPTPIGLIIRMIIQEKNLVKTEVARKMGMKSQNLYKVFGQESFTGHQVEQWAEALGVSPSYIHDRAKLDILSNRAIEDGNFGAEVVKQLLEEIKVQYEERLKAKEETLSQLKSEVKFNRELINDLRKKLESSQDATGQVFQHPALQKGEEMERLAA